MNRRITELRHLPIETFIPHRAAMRLIDRLIEADEDHALTEADVSGASWTTRGGAVSSWFGIEYMAQTVAAWSGHRAWSQGGAPRIGMLLGSRRYETACPSFPQGCTLRIEARTEFIGANGLGMFDCRITIDDRVVATARLSVIELGEKTEALAHA